MHVQKPRLGAPRVVEPFLEASGGALVAALGSSKVWLLGVLLFIGARAGPAQVLPAANISTSITYAPSQDPNDPGFLVRRDLGSIKRSGAEATSFGGNHSFVHGAFNASGNTLEYSAVATETYYFKVVGTSARVVPVEVSAFLSLHADAHTGARDIFQLDDGARNLLSFDLVSSDDPVQILSVGQTILMRSNVVHRVELVAYAIGRTFTRDGDGDIILADDLWFGPGSAAASIDPGFKIQDLFAEENPGAHLIFSDGFNQTLTPVPEPLDFSLFGLLALGGVIWRRWRSGHRAGPG